MDRVNGVIVKKCFKCGAIKSLSEFYRHGKMADGYLNKCKSCTKRDVAEHRSKNIERIREYDRLRSGEPHRRELNKRVAAEWRARHPNRRAAQIILNNAIRDGRIVPWPACAVPECNDHPEAHHPDYDRPLDVVWLCPSHHKKLHAEHRGF